MSEHKSEDMKGRVKEALGDITGDDSLKRDGKVDQASAAAKKTVDDTADAIKRMTSPKE